MNPQSRFLKDFPEVTLVLPAQELGTSSKSVSSENETRLSPPTHEMMRITHAISVMKSKLHQTSYQLSNPELGGCCNVREVFKPLPERDRIRLRF